MVPIGIPVGFVLIASSNILKKRQIGLSTAFLFITNLKKIS